MGERRNLFWDAVAGQAPMPRAAVTLGWEFMAADVERGTIEVGFTATEAFCNPKGEVLGGFLAAMLFDTVGPALLATLDAGEFQSTLEMKTDFLRPAAPGRLRGHGRVVRRDADIAFLEAELDDANGATVAKASATARVVQMDSRQTGQIGT
jgi:uncharacterized protein (TIGR00369 family)